MGCAVHKETQKPQSVTFDEMLAEIEKREFFEHQRSFHIKLRPIPASSIEKEETDSHEKIVYRNP